MNVVLVHGIFDSGRIFRHLVGALEKHGHRCWTPDLKLYDTRKGISDFAGELKEYIEKNIGPDEPLAVVGFSMGCIVARQYLQVLGGHHRTKAFFAISGPHHGSMTAYLYCGQGARDLRPHSPLLENLCRTESLLDGMALFSYWTPWDIMIVPAKNSDWELAQERLNVGAFMHGLMPAHRKVVADIVQRMDEIRS